MVKDVANSLKNVKRGDCRIIWLKPPSVLPWVNAVMKVHALSASVFDRPWRTLGGQAEIKEPYV